MREPPPHSTGIQAATCLRASFSVLLSASVVRPQLHELVIPRGDAQEPVLGLRAVAGHVERGALEPGALAAILDGEVPPQIDLRINAARVGEEGVRPGPLELGAHDRRLGVVGDRCALEVVDEDVELPAGLRIVEPVAVARLGFLEVRRIVEREAGDLLRRAQPVHRNRRDPERRRGRGGCKHQRDSGGPSGSHQVFIDSKNSALFLELRSLSSRKSIASMVPIGLRMRRSTYIFFS